MADVFNINLNKQVQPKAPLVLSVGDASQALKNEFRYGNIKVIEASEVQDKSKATGNPVFMALQFEPVTYEDEDGQQVQLKGLYIPCAIVEFTMQKNIVKTTVASAKFKGTVKEHMGIGDWQVSIKGMLISEDANYPEDLVKKLYQYCKCPKEVGVTHEICRMLDIYYIVLEEPALQNKQGFQNVQSFSISACSDEAVELTLNT